MKIHHLRNATFIIESGETWILIDPMLSRKGALTPFSFFRAKPKRNPTVELPPHTDERLSKVTHVLITHSQTMGIKALQHTDHLDNAGEIWLRRTHLPIATPSKDAAYLKSKGLNVQCAAEFWQATPFAGGMLTAVPAQHGHGWIHKTMANGAGFLLALPNEPMIYISGDTVLTEDVKRALTDWQPEITVVAAGNAKMDVGNPLLMDAEEILQFIRLSPGTVIANHMEALNHCHIDRSALRALVANANLSEKVLIPQDGDTLSLNN